MNADGLLEPVDELEELWLPPAGKDSDHPRRAVELVGDTVISGHIVWPAARGGRWCRHHRSMSALRAAPLTRE